MNLTILGTLFKWNQTIFLHLYIGMHFKVNLIYVLQTDYTFFSPPLFYTLLVIHYVLLFLLTSEETAERGHTASPRQIWALICADVSASWCSQSKDQESTS